MPETPVIRLRAGTRTVNLDTVPKLIAEAIHPGEPEEPYVLKAMQKTYLGPQGEFDGRTRPCTDEDLDLIREILGTPLPIGDEVTAADLQRFAEKFNRSP